MMFIHMKPGIIYNLFKHGLDYASRATTPMECRTKFLLLAVTHRLDVLSTMCALKGYYIASYRDPVKILELGKDSLPSDLLKQIKWVLKYHNPS